MAPRAFVWLCQCWLGSRLWSVWVAVCWLGQRSMSVCLWRSVWPWEW
jgi:hypothetical protein